MITLSKLALVSALLYLAVPGIKAAEIPPGTVITAQNIDQYMDATVQGHTLKSMLTERMEWMIRKQGFEPRIVHSSPVPMDPRWVAATKKYAGTVKYDPTTRRVTGYVAGNPFPDVKESDPDAAMKLQWNYYYGNPRGDFESYVKFTFVQVNDKGFQSSQNWSLQRYNLKGLLHYKDGKETQVGGGKDKYNMLLFATSPRDIAGLGTFTVFHDDGSFPSIWAYIPAVRRVRQLSGGAWADPIGGLDQLQSDIDIVNIYPTWFPKYKLLGKRWVLGTLHAKFGWDPSQSDPVKAFPGIGLSKAPYWNPVNDFEPVEVWVIEATPPPEHPYGREVLYMATLLPRYIMADVYDKKGEFWKEMLYQAVTDHGPDGAVAMASASGFTIDYQKRHATIFLQDKNVTINKAGVGPEDISLDVLRQAGH
ncbi:MAG: DUF1329 domain-containing protein [Herbaspirillum sp.]